MEKWIRLNTSWRLGDHDIVIAGSAVLAHDLGMDELWEGADVDYWLYVNGPISVSKLVSNLILVEDLPTCSVSFTRSTLRITFPDSPVMHNVILYTGDKMDVPLSFDLDCVRAIYTPRRDAYLRTGEYDDCLTRRTCMSGDRKPPNMNDAMVCGRIAKYVQRGFKWSGEESDYTSVPTRDVKDMNLDYVMNGLTALRLSADRKIHPMPSVGADCEYFNLDIASYPTEETYLSDRTKMMVTLKNVEWVCSQETVTVTIDHDVLNKPKEEDGSQPPRPYRRRRVALVKEPGITERPSWFPRQFEASLSLNAKVEFLMKFKPGSRLDMRVLVSNSYGFNSRDHTFCIVSARERE